MNGQLSYLIFKEFCHCPACYSDSLGNRKGTFVVDTDYFERTCECGFRVKMTEKEVIEYLKKKGVY